MAAFINNVLSISSLFFFVYEKFRSKWENAHQLLSELDCDSIMSSSVGLVSVLSHSWRSPVVSAQKSRVPATKIAKEIQNTSCQSLAHWKKWNEKQPVGDIELQQSYQEDQGLPASCQAGKTRVCVRACVCIIPVFFPRRQTTRQSKLMTCFELGLVFDSWTRRYKTAVETVFAPKEFL